MTTSDGAPEVWRVECEGGEVRSVEAWRQAWGSGLWRAFMPGPTTGDGAAFATPRAAVVALAARQGWPVVAVLAPGQPTRAEMDAAHVRAANARDQLRLRCEELTAERDALRSLLAAAARGEVTPCPTCAVRLATRETIRGELHRWCDECDASRVRRFPDEEGNRRDTLHAAALRAAMGGAK